MASANRRALLAEDSPIDQEIAREHLMSFGCVVDAVNSGDEALVAFDGHDYDVIVMDCQMPGMDGFEAPDRFANEKPQRAPASALQSSRSPL